MHCRVLRNVRDVLIVGRHLQGLVKNNEAVEVAQLDIGNTYLCLSQQINLAQAFR